MLGFGHFKREIAANELSGGDRAIGAIPRCDISIVLMAACIKERPLRDDGRRLCRRIGIFHRHVSDQKDVPRLGYIELAVALAGLHAVECDLPDIGGDGLSHMMKRRAAIRRCLSWLAIGGGRLLCRGSR